MRIIADLHIHSKHSRGCSKDLDIKNLEKYAKIKGIGLLGTGDFTHPIWIEEIKKQLSDEDGTNILKTKTGFPFLLQTEISLIYTWKNKGRRIHNVVLAPNLDVVEQITEALKKRGRVDYDGRPIFKIPCPEFVDMMRSISPEIEIIPAHVWTPHFSLFGSYNQFSSVKECFEDQTKHIHALETGLSSDPLMNWRISSLDNYNLVSFSDSHSFWPWRIGREATIFDIKQMTYKNILSALRKSYKEGMEAGNFISETIEVNPAYGKYHEDGHRNCNVRMSPSESIKAKNICPVCKRPVTIGVLHRVEELADRPEDFVLKTAHPFRALIPLHELISNLLNKGIATKFVWAEYYKLLKQGSEFDVLLNKSFDELTSVCHEKIAKAIIKNRSGNIKIRPGFDGEYGVPLFDAAEKIVQESTEETEGSEGVKHKTDKKIKENKQTKEKMKESMIQKKVQAKVQKSLTDF